MTTTATPDRMTEHDAIDLCRWAKACCPHQHFDEFTYEAWFELLRDLRAEDVKDAITTVAQNRPFVAPAEIRTEVARVREARRKAFGPLPVPPPEIADDVAADLAYRRHALRAISDGTVLRGQPLTFAIESALREVRALPPRPEGGRG